MMPTQEDGSKEPRAPVELSGLEDLTLELFQEIAWKGRRLTLHPLLLAKLATSRTEMEKKLAEGGAVYGVTTGMGYLANVRLDESEQQVHQANLLLGRAVGGPPYLDRAEARAVLLARLAGFLSGEVGVTPGLCSVLVDRLNDDVIPAIPRSGVGCAGEIIPLAHAFGPLIGVGAVLDGDAGAEAAAALESRGIAPYRLRAKEGIALLAGAPGALALAVARRRAALTLYRQFLIAAACAVDALAAPLSPYDPVVARLANDELMAGVLARFEALLSGSAPERGAIQAPVSFRVIPQVLTQLARTVDRFEEDVRRALSAVTDSPAFVDGRFVTNGGFHAIALAAGMDSLRIALIGVAELGAQHIHRLLDARFSGLPDQLTPSPGPHAGLVAVQKRVVGVLNELRRLATPASIGLFDTSLGQEDAMTFAFEASESLRRVEALAREVIACELLVCRQAWWLRGRPVATGLREVAAGVEAAAPPVDADRPLGPDIARLSALLAAGALVGDRPI